MNASKQLPNAISHARSQDFVIFEKSQKNDSVSCTRVSDICFLVVTLHRVLWLFKFDERTLYVSNFDHFPVSPAFRRESETLFFETEERISHWMHVSSVHVVLQCFLRKSTLRPTNLDSLIEKKAALLVVFFLLFLEDLESVDTDVILQKISCASMLYLDRQLGKARRNSLNALRTKYLTKYGKTRATQLSNALHTGMKLGAILFPSAEQIDNVIVSGLPRSEEQESIADAVVHVLEMMMDDLAHTLRLFMKLTEALIVHEIPVAQLFEVNNISQQLHCASCQRTFSVEDLCADALFRCITCHRCMCCTECESQCRHCANDRFEMDRVCKQNKIQKNLIAKLQETVCELEKDKSMLSNELISKNGELLLLGEEVHKLTATLAEASKWKFCKKNRRSSVSTQTFERAVHSETSQTDGTWSLEAETQTSDAEDNSHNRVFIDLLYKELRKCERKFRHVSHSLQVSEMHARTWRSKFECEHGRLTQLQNEK